MNLFACGIAMAALVAPVTGWSADNPSYQGQVLFLPRVDTPEQAGLYQNGTMRRNADGTWSVISIQALGEGDLTTLLGIGTVVVHATESVPSAVYLKVSGAEARCGSWGPEKVHQRRSGSHFDIHISTSLPSLSTCPATRATRRLRAADGHVYLQRQWREERHVHAATEQPVRRGLLAHAGLPIPVIGG
jgi:hypothetical protein